MAAVSQGLHDEGRCEYIAAGTTQFGRNRQALNPELGTCAPGAPREFARLVTLRQILVKFPPGECGRRLHQFALLGAQREVHPVTLSVVLAFPPAERLALAQAARPGTQRPPPPATARPGAGRAGLPRHAPPPPFCP